MFSASSSLKLHTIPKLHAASFLVIWARCLPWWRANSSSQSRGVLEPSGPAMVDAPQGVPPCVCVWGCVCGKCSSSASASNKSPLLQQSSHHGTHTQPAAHLDACHVKHPGAPAVARRHIQHAVVRELGNAGEEGGLGAAALGAHGREEGGGLSDERAALPVAAGRVEKGLGVWSGWWGPGWGGWRWLMGSRSCSCKCFRS
jgi:hypothetical protein